VTVLTLCVASVWLPGSPFSLVPPATAALPAAPSAVTTSGDLWVNATATPPAWESSSSQPFDASPDYAVTNQSFANLTRTHMPTPSVAVLAAPASMISVAVLLTGAILARFGEFFAFSTVAAPYLLRCLRPNVLRSSCTREGASPVSTPSPRNAVSKAQARLCPTVACDRTRRAASFVLGSAKWLLCWQLLREIAS